ncbi:MAG: DUF1684 domain-containing protein [Cytophagales bacterium]|nr:DUF1684 domain-containing protein [Cytophagales bacterium]
MKSSRLVPFVVIIAIAAFLWYSLSGERNSDAAYARTILEARQQAEAYMKTSPGSPFLKDSIPFEGLKYYPVDPAFRVKAKLENISPKQVVVLATSDGLEQRYLQYAFATFRLQDQENRLLILESMEMGPQRGKLFLAFADATSGGETYGAGRYLDLKKVRGATSIELDFNLAYNPYCAYNDAYSCPFPPKENVLKIAIRAGELTYHP